MAIDLAVDKFYGKVLSDPAIKEFFKNVEMKNLSKMMKAFLTMVFGGPSNYTGKSMRDGHAHLKVNDNHFDIVVNHLADTLKELGVNSELIQEVAEVVESVRDEVLGR